MTPYFLDISALVKRYVTTETGSVWVQGLFDPALGNVAFIASIGPVELCAALSRKVRMGEIALADRDAMADYVFVHVDPLMSRAEALAKSHGLRAYDAVQLASAIHAKQRLDPALAPALVMVAADAALLSAAQSEGLLSDDPNQHCAAQARTRFGCQGRAATCSGRGAPTPVSSAARSAARVGRVEFGLRRLGERAGRAGIHAVPRHSAGPGHGLGMPSCSQIPAAMRSLSSR